MTKTDVTLVHSLGPEAGKYGIPDRFTYPFRYTPAPVTMLAAGMVLEHISACDELQAAFSEGKMLGVLVVRGQDGSTGFLAGFSGLAGGRGTIPYFVPPVMDLTDPEGHFKKEERIVSKLNEEIRKAGENPELKEAARNLETAKEESVRRISAWKSRMAESKARRDATRKAGTDSLTEERLIKESQYEKAQLKRITAECRAAEEEAARQYAAMSEQIRRLKEMRQRKSEELQEWIFRNMVVENALGEQKSILQIFEGKGAVPPGGAGECAAPKLLHYAYTHGLHPLAMGEFWYGAPSGKQGEVRLHGKFYPSCTGKCGPLLGFMLQGLDVELPDSQGTQGTGIPEQHGMKARTLYEDDDIIVAEKPSGMLSSPGKTGEMSLQEILSETTGGQILSVHRLDMDTSGLIIYARNPKSQKDLQRQFERHEVEKEYTALLDAPGGWPHPESLAPAACGEISRAGNAFLQPGEQGVISLPIAPDHHDRPRQKVDHDKGKDAVTHFEVTGRGNGWIRVRFRPITGRTHQLRVHAAHPFGLSLPIKGDRLYGGSWDPAVSRLCLHASKIRFRHPSSGEEMVFESCPPF